MELNPARIVAIVVFMAATAAFVSVIVLEQLTLAQEPSPEAEGGIDICDRDPSACVPPTLTPHPVQLQCWHPWSETQTPEPRTPGLQPPDPQLQDVCPTPEPTTNPPTATPQPTSTPKPTRCANPRYCGDPTPTPTSTPVPTSTPTPTPTSTPTSTPTDAPSPTKQTRRRH